MSSAQTAPLPSAAPLYQCGIEGVYILAFCLLTWSENDLSPATTLCSRNLNGEQYFLLSVLLALRKLLLGYQTTFPSDGRC